MNERQHLSRVAALGCMACQLLGYGETPAEIHHPRTGQGGAQRASHWLAIPLCPEHHRGAQGVHGADFYGITKLTEMDLLAETIRRLSQ